MEIQDVALGFRLVGFYMEIIFERFLQRCLVFVFHNQNLVLGISV